MTPSKKDLTKFWTALDNAAGDGPTIVKSIRIPAGMHEAMRVAVDLGLADNVNDAYVSAGARNLEAFAQRLAFEAYYLEFPEARPSITEVALAMAELSEDPLAAHPDLIERAAVEVVARKRDAQPEDVLLYAAGLASGRSPKKAS